MNENSLIWLVASLVIATITSSLAYNEGKTTKDNEIRKKLLHCGIAQYNSLTGEFEWKEDGAVLRCNSSKDLLQK